MTFSIRQIVRISKITNKIDPFTVITEEFVTANDGTGVGKPS